MHSSREIPGNCRSTGSALFWVARRCFFPIAIALASLVGTATAHGDDAILLDGSHHPGELRFRDERFEFFLAGQNEPLLWPRLDRVGLSPKALAPLAPPFWWQVTLTNGDHFACHLAEIESNAIICDSSWFQGLRVRRNAIRAIERPLGWAPWLRQDFSKEARGWKETRESGETPPTLGLGGLSLGAPAQMLQFTPDAPLPFGQVFLHLKDPASASGKRWQLRLRIDGDGAFHSIKILFGGNAPVEMQAPGLKTLQQDVRLADTEILLQVEIGPALIQVNANARLASWIEHGFRVARLRSLSLEPADPAKDAKSPVKLLVQEFVVARRLEPLPRPPAHANLDEVWLESGDQLFGSYRSLSSQFLELGTAREPRRILCSQIRGLYPKQLVARSVSLPAPWRLTLADPCCAEPSRLTGVIRSWGQRDVILIHPLLGELKIPRSQIQSVAQASSKTTDARPHPTQVPKP